MPLLVFTQPAIPVLPLLSTNEYYAAYKQIITLVQFGKEAVIISEERYKNSKGILSKKLSENIEKLKKTFERSCDIVYREFQIGGIQDGLLVFINGLVNIELVNMDVLEPLLNCEEKISKSTMIQLNKIKHLLQNQIIRAVQISWGNEFQEVVDHILSGYTVLLIDSLQESLFIELKEWEKRAVEEPTTETVTRGPREGFTENLLTNTTLVRKRLKTPKLKMEKYVIGQLSKTDIVVTYLEGIADNSLIQEIKKRLSTINIDAILESGYIEELIEDSPFSVFPQTTFTERPDKVVGCLLEGQAAIIIDNTPFALIMPQTFFQMLQSSQDSYDRYFVATFTRWIRYLFLMISVTLPSIYIALTTFHQEMLPTGLLLSMAASRESVPFPAIAEAFMMEITFEALREAGVRMPRQIGSAVSIVGALVIGQAAVQAGLISAPMVIIVSTTGIASLMFPTHNQASAVRLLRFPMMLLASTLGLYGILLGVMFILIHMSKLRTFGVPYLSPLGPLHFDSLKDVLVRVPRWAMTMRPSFTEHKNLKRMGNALRHRPPKKNR